MTVIFQQVKRRWRDPIFVNKLDRALDWVVLAGAAGMLVGLVLHMLGGAQ